MENYTQGESKEIATPVPFNESADLMNMQVNKGSKIRNLMGYASARMKNEKIRQICWHGCGEAISKTITCAEIMKRQNKKLYQITHLRYKRLEEYWEPKMEGLEKLRVNKNIPEIFILLSKDGLNSSEPGYQDPGNINLFWNEMTKKTNSKKSGDQRRQGIRDSRNAPAASALAPGKKKKKNVQRNLKEGANAVKKGGSIGDEVKRISQELK
ncbi:hypothetical protein SNE40_023269 [Patella caerulea]|uniref:DNA/RNA-binding protein Alba-like domain-containing protein n=1 Tax=Patella caerulea TaxID=87958 RepID=A0AAN8GHV0_PATCE